MAVFNSDTVEYRQWKYRVEEFQVILGGEDGVSRSYDLPRERVQSFMVLDNYEKNKIPVIRIELILESSRYYEIVENKNFVKFRLKFVRFYNEVGKEKYNENTPEEEETTNVYHSYIDDTFDLILDDSNIDPQIGIKEEATDNADGEIVEDDVDKPEAADNLCEFMLYKAGILNKSKTLVNYVIKNSNMTDAICFILSETGMDNVLMATVDNQKIYDTIVIPPLEAYEALKFLDTYYGIYRCGTIFYFGIERNYIIKYNGICNCYVDDEIKTTTFVIPKKTNEAISTTCSVYDENASEVNYIYCNPETVDIRNETITANMITGTGIDILDPALGTVTKLKSNAITRDGGFSKTVYNKTENIFFDAIYSAVMEANSSVVEISVSGYDITAITPNKQFVIAFEDKSISEEYNGNYILTYGYHTWIRDGDNFNLASTLILKKSTATY